MSNSTTLTSRPSTEDRNQARAEAQYASYRFRIGAIMGVTVVFCTSPEGAIYTVPMDNGAHRCNCPQSTQRLRGTNQTCKHTHMAARYLREEMAKAEQMVEAAAPAPAPRLTQEERAAKLTADGWPD